MTKPANLFDKAMPHRNDPATKQGERKCPICEKWIPSSQFASHKHEESK